MSETFQNGFALLVGVGRCTYTPWTLPATSRDAEALKLTLTDPRRCGYPDENIRLLTHEAATRGRILDAMGELEKKIAQVPNSTVIVFYSGHGWLDQHGDYYLMPTDADPHKFSSTALPGEIFTNALRRMQPSRLLVLLDTCHAGGMAEAKDGIPPGLPPGRKAPPEGLAEALGKGQGRAVLSSCRGEETSLVLPDGHLSLFTHCLVEAFSGGLASSEAHISVLNLCSYTSRAVVEGAKALSHTQTPFLKAETEDFTVALCTRKTPENDSASPTSLPKPSPRNSQTYAGRDILKIQAHSVGHFTTGDSTTNTGPRRPRREK
jgi:hypothetical protein